MPEIKENLDLLIKLQPLFKRVLGEWKFGEKAYSLDKQCVGIYSSSIITSRGEFLYFNTFFGHFTESDNPIRVPTFEELWGMVDWSKYPFTNFTKGVLEIDVKGRIYTRYGKWIDPYTALLKALCSQEGI